MKYILFTYHDTTHKISLNDSLLIENYEGGAVTPAHFEIVRIIKTAHYKYLMKEVYNEPI